MWWQFTSIGQVKRRMALSVKVTLALLRQNCKQVVLVPSLAAGANRNKMQFGIRPNIYSMAQRRGEFKTNTVSLLTEQFS